MDTIPFIKEILSKPALRVFLSDNDSGRYFGFAQGFDGLKNFIWDSLLDIQRRLREHTEDEKLKTIKSLHAGFREFGIERRQTFERAFRERKKVSQWSIQRDLRWYKGYLYGFIDELVSCNYLEQREVEGELEHKVDIDAVINSLHEIKSMEDLLLHNANSSNCFTNDEKSRALLLITAFPALCELKDPYKMLRFLLELSTELGDLPNLICQACEGQPQALLLIGRLLSVKPRAYDTWNRVKDDMFEIKMSNNGASDNYMWHIYSYCYDDLPPSLTLCFLYLACYPMNYEIPARSLTEIWIAEEFVEPQEGETIEETANKYLEQLVQRSLVWVSKRSISGTIKCCRVRQSIQEFCIKKSSEEEFLVANTVRFGYNEEIDYVARVAFYNDDNKQYTERPFWRRAGDYNHIVSVVCFDFDINVLGENILAKFYHLHVLELRKSTIPKTYIGGNSLKYLGLRGSNISEHCQFSEYMCELITLDVRDTNIETLPEFLWNIKTLRHVYVNPSPQIKGPPSTANIDDLQILKTVAVPESWLENFPQFLINLRKLAISNRDNPNSKSNPYWKSISNLLSHMSNLLSMTIIGDIVPSEFVDIRAFPNLETVKSIKLEGEWICRKLFIDHVKFPPNLVKLTLTKSGLKEDPMPRLERLQALKFLSLQDEAYTGTQMVCSANGFPQLQLLELKKFENLESLEAKQMAMPRLTQVHVDRCPKLKLNFHSGAFSSEVTESIKNEETGTTAT